MYWADKIAEDIIKTKRFTSYWVDDMKTPSGFAHVGSMLGPVFHSLVYRALKDAGKEAKYTFVINDFDPIDGLPESMVDKFGKYMGCPLKNAESPDPKFKNMAECYADDFVSTFRYLGVEAKLLSSWEMYHEGEFDEVIRAALNNSEKIQEIYRKVSGSKKKEKGWLPFQVICPKCGKLGTTRVYEWDGEEVSFKCEPNMVAWAEGCGHEGKVSPFGGTGKLPWKVDWAAHWKVIGVTVEGAGKDHASAGGSYDIAMEICKDVFDYNPPYKLPYEFILIGGKKMSSSKGIGLKAHDLKDIFPPEAARFLFARHNYRKQSNFDPMGTVAIPDLFDEYDKAWRSYNNNERTDLARMFELSQIIKTPARNEKLFIPRFREITNYLQQPNDLKLQFNKLKGSELTEEENEILEKRTKYARIWIERYAPSEFNYQITKEIPKEAEELNAPQKKYLANVVGIIEKTDSPEDLQQMLYDLSKDLGVDAKSAFSAIYTALIGKAYGPKAGWFLLQLPRGKVIERLKEVTTNSAIRQI